MVHLTFLSVFFMLTLRTVKMSTRIRWSTISKSLLMSATQLIVIQQQIVILMPSSSIILSYHQHISSLWGPPSQGDLGKGNWRDLLSWERDKLNVMFVLCFPWEDSQYRIISLLKSLTFSGHWEFFEKPGSRSLLTETGRDPAFKSASN